MAGVIRRAHVKRLAQLVKLIPARQERARRSRRRWPQALAPAFCCCRGPRARRAAASRCPSYPFLGQQLQRRRCRRTRPALERARRYAGQAARWSCPTAAARAVPGRAGRPRSTKCGWPALVTAGQGSHQRAACAASARRNEGPLHAPGPGLAQSSSAPQLALRTPEGRARSPPGRRAHGSRAAQAGAGGDRVDWLDVDASLGGHRRARSGAASAKQSSRSKSASREGSPRSSATVAVSTTVLGYFETRYDRSERVQARSYNLRLAASKLDGHRAAAGRRVRLQRRRGSARRSQRLTRSRR